MVRRTKRKPRKVQPNQRRRRSNRNRNRSRSSRPVKSEGLGRTIVRGVRNLISAIPGGTAFLSIADVVFKSVGYSQIRQVDGLFVADNVTIGALATRFCINYVNILLSSRECIRSPSNARDSQFRYNITTPWTEARLIEFTVVIAPTNPVSKRMGIWTLGFKPFYDSRDHATEMSRSSVPGRVGIMGYPNYTTGPASSKLSLTYRPRVTDGHVFQFHPLDTMFGCICIRFDCYSRDTVADFTPEQFALELNITGKLELRNRVSDDDNRIAYLDKFDQPVKDVRMYVIDSETAEEHTLLNCNSRSVTVDNKMTATFVKDNASAYRLLGLEDMSM